MGAAKRRGVAAQPRDLTKQFVRRRTRKQCGKQRVFLGACRIDGIDGIIFHGRLATKIGAKLLTRHAGRRFDGDHPLCRNAVPVRNGRLRNADFAGKLDHAACRVDRAIEYGVAHVGPPIPAAKCLIFLCSAKIRRGFGSGQLIGIV